MRISKKYLILIIVLILGLVFLNFIPNFTEKLGNFTFKIFSPLQRFFIKTGNSTVNFFGMLISIRELSKENTELKKKNLELETEVVKLNETAEENRILRQGLKIAESGQVIVELALIAGKDVQSLGDWILINKGKNHGLAENMTVISAETALVGKVTEVMDDFSKVMLITNKESIVAALIEGERSQGLVKKEEKGKLFMDFIPRGEKLEIGKRVITSGMDNIYSAGILIGKIESIDLSQNQLFQKVIISPAVDFSKLEKVFIIKSK